MSSALASSGPGIHEPNPSIATEAGWWDGSDQPLYLPLLEGQIIRLLEIAPGSKDDDVVLRLLVAELGYHPSYDALSYVWGDTTNLVSVTCNGRRIDITPNLKAAFVMVRYRDRPRIVWADAICINQRNVTERSHHVSFMGSVYSHATKVLVCIGDDVDGGAKNVVALVEENTLLISGYKSILDMPILPPSDPLYDDPRWRSLATLLESPWFTRGWVLQEVGLAKDPRALYGDADFNYRDLMRLGVWAKTCAPNLEPRAGVSFYSAHVDWLDWADDWQRTATYPEATLLDMLDLVRGLECREFRDHIYAFLGHPLARVEDGSGTIVKPDYSRPILDIFVELAVKLLPKDGFRVLACVENNEQTLLDDTVSWIPFCRGNGFVSCSFGIYTGFWYEASAGIEAVSPELMDSNFLKVQGVIVDIVTQTPEFSDLELEEMGRPLYGPNEIAYTPTMNLIWKKVHDKEMPCAYAMEGRQDALSLTLCAGLSTFNCAEETLEQHRNEFATFQRIWELSSPSHPGPSNFDPESTHIAEKFWVDMKQVCSRRKFLFTEKGHYGLGPCIAKPDDLICVFFGAKVPFLLRKASRGGHYKLVGEAYIHGIMRGKAIEMVQTGALRKESFIIC